MLLIQQSRIKDLIETAQVGRRRVSSNDIRAMTITTLEGFQGFWLAESVRTEQSTQETVSIAPICLNALTKLHDCEHRALRL
jgi:hypothetical protein